MVAAGEPPYAVLIGQAWRASFTRMLLLSLGLHAAVIMIVQPRPFPDVAEIVVIDARLSERTGDQAVPEVPPPAPPTALSEAAPSPTPQAVSRPELAAVPERPAAVATAKPTAPMPKLEAPVVPPPAARTESAVTPSLPSVPVMIDTNWYEARQLDVQPVAARAISPRYPPDAARQGIEGTVKLRLRIDEFGVVKDAEVEEGDPPGVFDESALEAFRKGQFRPAQKDGRPVRALIYIRVRYELDRGG